MVKEKVDIHADEPPAKAPLTGRTIVELQSLKAALGTSGPSQFVALAAALSSLVGGVIAAMNDKTQQSKKISNNKAKLLGSSLQTPAIKPADVDASTKTINNVMGSVRTPDTEKVQRAASKASNVRDPEALNEFTSRRVDQINDRNNRDNLELGEDLKTVNAVQEQVEST